MEVIAKRKTMRIIIFDVGNAFCALVCSPNGYGMMIDCGSNSEKENPIDTIRKRKDWLMMKPYQTQSGCSYPLALLHITHPDDDHVRNAGRIKSDMPPYLLLRTYVEEFDDYDTINNDYKTNLDSVYRGSNPESIDWGFEENEVFQVPVDEVKETPILNSKIRNNCSIIRYIKFAGYRILFTGDLEIEGWNWLLQNNGTFKKLMNQGLDILIAPHHGHKSGFPAALFELTGNVSVIILSKDSENTKVGTDIATQYSTHANGMGYFNLHNNLPYKGKVLSTRSNGNIYMEFSTLPDQCNIYCDTASSNHCRF